MPLYEYECQDCHERFEATQSIENRKNSDCPHCSGVGEQKLTPIAFDVSAMGMDATGFPTFADKWARRHEKRGTPLRTTGKARPD